MPITSANLVSTKYVFPCDIVGKRISIVMYLKHTRCDKTGNYIAYEKLKVHQTYNRNKIRTGVYIIISCDFCLVVGSFLIWQKFKV